MDEFWTSFTIACGCRREAGSSDHSLTDGCRRQAGSSDHEEMRQRQRTPGNSTNEGDKNKTGLFRTSTSGGTAVTHEHFYGKGWLRRFLKDRGYQRSTKDLSVKEMQRIAIDNDFLSLEDMERRKLSWDQYTKLKADYKAKKSKRDEARSQHAKQPKGSTKREMKRMSVNRAGIELSNTTVACSSWGSTKISTADQDLLDSIGTGMKWEVGRLHCAQFSATANQGIMGTGGPPEQEGARGGSHALPGSAAFIAPTRDRTRNSHSRTSLARADCKTS